MKKIIKRVKLESPDIFKKITNIGLTVGAVGGAILLAPVSFPAIITTMAGYLVAIGGVASAVAKITVKDSDKLNND